MLYKVTDIYWMHNYLFQNIFISKFIFIHSVDFYFYFINDILNDFIGIFYGHLYVFICVNIYWIQLCSIHWKRVYIGKLDRYQKAFRQVRLKLVSQGCCVCQEREFNFCISWPYGIYNHFNFLVQQRLSSMFELSSQSEEIYPKEDSILNIFKWDYSYYREHLNRIPQRIRGNSLRSSSMPFDSFSFRRMIL